jgi:SAM-dependent methyltransferase
VEGYPYWGEISREELLQLTEKARETGWREAVSAAFQGRDPGRYDSIASGARAGFLPLLPPSPEGVVLEIGAGLGAVSEVLAHHYGTVCCLEPVAERLRFLQLRMQQEGLENVKLVQAALPCLPFPDATFDAIVMIGVLEWVGEWTRELDPREAQVAVLEQMRGKLKTGGVLLVGIENRFGYASFRGRRDHSGLPYTSLMPRWLASLAVSLAGSDYRTPGSAREGYRTYTYGLGGYRKLFKDAGFGEIAVYWPHPSYIFPRWVFPLQNRALLRHRVGERPWKRKAAQLAASLGLMPLLVPDYLILARSEE